MKLSRKDIRNLIIAGVVLVVIGLIIWRWKFKSNYTVASITSGTANSPESNLYSNLSLCQNNFVNQWISTTLSTHSNIYCDSGVVYVAADEAHGYTNGNLVTVQGVSSDGTTTTKGFNGDGISVTKINDFKFSYSAVGGTCTPSTKAASWTVVDAGATNAAQGFSWLTSETATSTSNANRVNCMTSNITAFMSAKCPYATYSSTAPTDSAIAVYYNTYIADKDKIVAAYSRILASASSGTTPTRETVLAARKADLTAALRKYLSQACTSFYASSTLSADPGTASTTGYVTSPYNGFTASATSALKTAATSTQGALFNGGLITTTNITNWALYASYTPTVGAVVTGANANLTTVAAGNTRTPSTQYTKNSEIAADIGPGTVTTLGPLNGTTGVASTAALNWFT
jgi:hypothetical protein